MSKTQSYQSESLHAYRSEFETLLTDLQRQLFIKRLWSKDPSLWKKESEAQGTILNSLGWLTVPETMLAEVDQLTEFSEEVRAGGFKHALLLGMGGSSLCAEVLRRTFGHVARFPKLLVLDSTVPAAIRGVEDNLDLEKTLFIVSSKSGRKIEPQVFLEYFFDQASRKLGARAGHHFVAITDPGSPLEMAARDRSFRRVFLNPPDIGGRYSALSYFGMVPAAVAGYEIKEMLVRARRAMQACQSGIDSSEDDAARLGTALGLLANRGRDKLTLALASPIDSLGLWIEQLIAESTGKEGRGIVPVAGEFLGRPEIYDEDRVFVSLRTRDQGATAIESKLEAVESNGHPVIRRVLTDALDLGAEFFTWEFATAIAGAIMKVNPFDQPNVEESLVNTATLVDKYEEQGHLPDQVCLAGDGRLRIYGPGLRGRADQPSNSAGNNLGGSEPTVASVTAAHLESIGSMDYVALTPFLAETSEHQQVLEQIRMLILEAKRVATTVGYGPRFLHSTGQLHKGGPPKGVFLQITTDDAEDIAVPDRPYTFSVIKQAQALGDFESLAGRNLRILRFHLGANVVSGLTTLYELLRQVLKSQG
jgi:transaldolase / glucose-6-phosphate isomerase